MTAPASPDRPPGGYRFHFSEHGSPDVRDVPPGHVPVSDADLAEPPFKLEDLSLAAEPAPLWAQDLLLVARAAHIADRVAARGAAADRWSRTIELSVPVLDLRRWTALAQNRLTLLLQTLTADDWRLTLRPSRRFARGAQPSIDEWRAGEVCLYSGGLDSAAYVAARAAAGERDGGGMPAPAHRPSRPGPLLPVMFVDGSLKAAQLDVLRRASRGARREVRLLPASHTPLGVHESTSRSRGLLFAAFGVYAAAAHGCRTLAVPENGLLALNPPLSPGRVAAASTRAVHPRTLDLLDATVAAVGGSVTVVNPFLHRTKGEVVRVALDAGLRADDLAATLGCARPPAKRGRPHHHCGRCHACLVRRAGLLAALGHDPTAYETDLPRLPLDGEQAVDLRAVLGWLRTPFTPADLVADLPIPAGYALGDLVAVVGRAREELAAALGALLPDAAGPPVRRG